MLLDKRQLTLAALLMACFAFYFWSQSRYPALDQKAQMGQRTSISAIAFDTVVAVDISQPYLERVWRSSLNWGYTNWKGMTFGLLFAAAFITFLRLLPPTASSRFAALNALKGMLIGVPLGVCANCSTPIAYGMVKAGTRVETALATLFSSPTLNIYVLTTTFSLLPLHMALLKVAGVVLVVLVVVPMLSQRLRVNTSVSGEAVTVLEELSSLPQSLRGQAGCELPSRHWWDAVTRVVRAFGANLLFIVKMTLPLMVLAGILGAFVIEAIPGAGLAEVDTQLVNLLAVSVVATFLPVPMMFDVITVMVLMASGLSKGLSMALLFALGIFSIYPALVIARRISLALSVSVFASIVLIATALGTIAQYLDEQSVAAATQKVSQQLPVNDAPELTAPRVSGERLQQMAKASCGQLPETDWQARCEHRVMQEIREGRIDVVTPNVRDTAVCDAMTNSEAQQGCYAQVGHDFAVISGNLDHCRVIPGADLQASCYETIMVNRVKKQFALEQSETIIAPVSGKMLSVAAAVTAIASAPTVAPASLGGAPGLAWQPIEGVAGAVEGEAIRLEHTPHLASPLSIADAKTQFARLPAEKLGIVLPFDFRLSDFYEPFKYGRGIASGDVDNNGFPDLVFASSKGPVIFVNQGNGTFARQPLVLPVTTPVNTFVVALVDINNDGWQDLFFSTYGGTNYWIENRQGRWAIDEMNALANPATSLTMAVGFADINQNGTLDAFMGNWTAGAENQFATKYSRNAWWVNQGSTFTAYDDDAVNGETLSVLLSDFTHNGRVDLVVGNDGDAPDLYYVDKVDGGFAPILPQQGVVPVTSLTTMSVDTADFNNDLRLDIFTTDMSFSAGEVPSYCDLIDNVEDAQKCRNLLQGWLALKELRPQWCERQPAVEQKNCLVAFAAAIARDTRNPHMCDRITPDFADVQVLCRRMADTMPIEKLSHTDHIPQQHNNKLLLATVDGKFADATASMQVDKSFWSWNSKAADLDNDGWQDILVANGFGFGEQQNEIHSNVFFHNQQGKKFVRAHEAFGLNELLNTPSYTYLDLDNDGDLDVVATAIMAAPRVYINQGKRQSLSFVLRDENGNRFCVGCKVTVFYGETGQQLKELKLSGGYLSYDDLVLMFGLGEEKQVDRVVVQWSDGALTEIRQPFATGGRYRISRNRVDQ